MARNMKKRRHISLSFNRRRQKTQNGQCTVADCKLSKEGNLYDNALAENFFFILKTECSYRHKAAAFAHTNELIDRYIYFYNRERIQLKTGEAPFTRCLF